MKNTITTILLLSLLIIFSLFIKMNEKYKTVLKVLSPVQLAIDLNNDKVIDNDETVCIDGIETFSLEISDEFFDKYAKKFNLNRNEMISLGYLAQEYAQKTLENEKVSINFTPKVTSECRYANVKVNGIDYKNILKHSGFGIIEEDITSKEKFKTNLEKAKKLNLVILNHRSGKFHTLDCPYGNIAHDKIIIPQKQLPANTKPCKFCHSQSKKVHPDLKLQKDKDIYNIPNVPQPPLLVNDGNIKIYFTDFTKNLIPNNRCETIVCKEFVNLTNSAKETIDIALYGYDEVPAITTALTKAKARGVKIRYVFDENYDVNKTFYKNNHLISNLAQTYRSDKSNTKSLSNMIMHNKFIIFDNSIIYTGSMNFSKTGLSNYDVNDIVIITSKDVANLYTKEFEQMLNGKFHTQKEKLNQTNKFKIGSSEIEIYFSPKDKQSKRIIELIKNAKHYIYMPTFLITHQKITEALIDAKKRGIDVRIIIDGNSTTTAHSTHSILRNNGILLKTENYAGKLHSKMIIIDDEYLITGSMNFSNSGENKNDENTVIIKNSKIAKAHKDFFLYLWTIIPNKFLKYNVRAEGPESIGSCSDGIDNNFNGKTDKFDSNCF